MVSNRSKLYRSQNSSIIFSFWPTAFQLLVNTTVDYVQQSFRQVTRAPKNCMCLPTIIGDTQHATHSRRWKCYASGRRSRTEREVSIDTFAQNFLKFLAAVQTTEWSCLALEKDPWCTGCSGNGRSTGYQSTTVRPIPPIDSVAQIGSPENSSCIQGTQEANHT